MLKDKLLGGWLLQSWTITYSDSDRITYPFGEHAIGTIMYTTDGWMSASISRAKRDLFPEGQSIKSLPEETRADAYNSYFSYSGRYVIEGNDVIHKVEQSLNPNFVGTEQVRHIKFDGDTLILSGEDQVNSTERRHQIIWVRG